MLIGLFTKVLAQLHTRKRSQAVIAMLSRNSSLHFLICKVAGQAADQLTRRPHCRGTYVSALWYFAARRPRMLTALCQRASLVRVFAVSISHVIMHVIGQSLQPLQSGALFHNPLKHRVAERCLRLLK